MFRFERLRVWHKAVDLYAAVEDIAKMLSGLKRVSQPI